jgi:hypothetical protein
MMCLLCLQEPLKSTIHQQKFLYLDLNSSAKAAVSDIEDDKLWMFMYIILCSVFPALRALHYCDASKPSLDKIFFLSHRTTEAIEKSNKFLDDESLFGSMKTDANSIHEGNFAWGSIQDNHDEDDEDDNVGFRLEPSSNDDDSDSDVYEEETNDVFNLTFWEQIKCHWNYCKQSLKASI